LPYFPYNAANLLNLPPISISRGLNILDKVL
jgi:hypothetical protein